MKLRCEVFEGADYWRVRVLTGRRHRQDFFLVKTKGSTPRDALGALLLSISRGWVKLSPSV